MSATANTTYGSAPTGSENPTREQENFRIGVAVADKPTGPFKDLSDRPVFDPGYPIIDANILFDDASGKTYLYYSRCCYKHAVESEVSAWAKTKGWFDEIEESWIYGVELKPDFSGVIGEPVALLCPPKTMDDPQAKWENRSVTTHEVNRRWTEAFVYGETRESLLHALLCKLLRRKELCGGLCNASKVL